MVSEYTKRIRFLRVAIVAAVLVVAGCAPEPAATPAPADGAAPAGGPEAVTLVIGGSTPDGKSDPERVRAADVSILFVGNSHTSMHDLPNLVGRMIRHRHPQKQYYAHVVPVGFLEDAARDGRFKYEIENRPWKYVLLQAQKISVSGKHDYSRQDGIDMAKSAKGHGATVIFYPEWGLKGVAGDGARQEKVYREMAQAAEVKLAPVARAWDLALAERPDLVLYSGDGNHQSAVGAFLTAAVLVGRLTSESPADMATFPFAPVNETDRKFLAEIAAKALVEDGGRANKQ